MFLLVIGILAIIIGIVRGGSLKNLFDGEIKAWYLFLLAILLFLAQYIAGFAGIEAITDFSFWIQFASYLILFIAIFLNLDSLWMYILLGGTLLNFVAIFLNQGKMPVYETSLNIAGLGDGAGAYMTRLASSHVVAGQTTRLWFLGDIVPIPIPVVGEVISIGTIIIALAMFMIIQNAMIYTYVDEDEYNKLQGLDSDLGLDSDPIPVMDSGLAEDPLLADSGEIMMEETISLENPDAEPIIAEEQPENLNAGDEAIPVIEEVSEDIFAQFEAEPKDFTEEGDFEFGGDDIFAHVEDDGTFDELSEDAFSNKDDLGDEFFADFGLEEDVEPLNSNINLDSDAPAKEDINVAEDIKPAELLEETQEEFSFEEPEVVSPDENVEEPQDEFEFAEAVEENAEDDGLMLDDIDLLKDFADDDAIPVSNETVSAAKETSDKITPDIPNLDVDTAPISDAVSSVMSAKADEAAVAGDIAKAAANVAGNMVGGAPSGDAVPDNNIINEVEPLDFKHDESEQPNISEVQSKSDINAQDLPADSADINAPTEAAENADEDSLLDSAKKAVPVFAAGAVAGAAVAGFTPKANNVQPPASENNEQNEPEAEKEEFISYDSVPESEEEYDFLAEFEEDDAPYSPLNEANYDNLENQGFVSYKEEPLLDDAEKDLDDVELEDLIPTEDKIKDAKGILSGETANTRPRVTRPEPRVVETEATKSAVDIDNPFVITDGRIVENPYYKFRKGKPKKAESSSADGAATSEKMGAGVYVMNDGNLSRADRERSNTQEFVPKRESEARRYDEEEKMLRQKEERLRRFDDNRNNPVLDEISDNYNNNDVVANTDRNIPESTYMSEGDSRPVGEDGKPYEKVEMKIGDVEIKFWKKDGNE